MSAVTTDQRLVRKDKDLKAAVDFIVGKDMMKIGQKENLERLLQRAVKQRLVHDLP